MSAREAFLSVSSSPSHALSQKDPFAALMIRVAAADERALAELYAHMSRKIFAFALRHVNDRDLAEGVVVETMFEVWKSASRFIGGSSVGTWILGIARHKALDEVRRRARCVPYDETKGAQIADDCATAFDGIAANQTREQLSECIARLPVEQRECIHLAFYEELSLAEIADIQGVPENTVKTRLFHARRKLKILLTRRMDCANDSA